MGIEQFVGFHITASENLRAATVAGSSKREKLDAIEECMRWTKKMLTESGTNIMQRMLALGMYQTASGMKMFLEVEYDTVVVGPASGKIEE
jgi:hypothetical protein